MAKPLGSWTNVPSFMASEGIVLSFCLDEDDDDRVVFASADEEAPAAATGVLFVVAKPRWLPTISCNALNFVSLKQQAFANDFIGIQLDSCSRTVYSKRAAALLKS